MHVLGGAELVDERAICASEYRHIGAAAEFSCVERILQGGWKRDIACDDTDTNNVDVFTCKGHHEGDGIITCSVGVNEERTQS